MRLYAQIYEFAASAGSFEGYVYHRQNIDVARLHGWAGHIFEAYGLLPGDVREEIQDSCDKTLGRAVKSLIPLLGNDHDVVAKLMSMIKGRLPESPDDFQKKKWFEE